MIEINLDKYPFKASARTTLSPDKVDPNIYGHHASIVKSTGERDYGFETELGRDKFVKDFIRYEAAPCWWGEL